MLNSRNALFVRGRIQLMCLLLLFLLQSCATILKDAEVAASFDAAFQEFCYPNFSESSCSDVDLGYNVMYVLMMGEKAFKTPPTTFSDVMGNEYLLASNSNENLYLYSSVADDNIKVATADKINSSFRLMDHIRFMGGLEFVNKRSKDGNRNIGLHYVEIPLYGIYEADLSEGKIFGGLGPYFAYGIGGKIKESTTGTKIKSFDKNSGYKPFDAGLNLTCGYKIKDGFRFSLAYDLGLANIDRNDFGNKVKNRSISLNVMYPLAKIIEFK